MAFVPGARNDIFISYAHFDNDVGATGERWVSDFRQRLESALKMRLGCPVDIYFDERSLEGHHVLNEMLDNVRSSAIFVPILSPSYVNRSWTKDELGAFVEGGDSSRIIFTIERYPLDTEEAYPPSLRERKRSAFWFRTEESGVVDILTPSLKRDRYLGAMNDVVEHMARQLRTLKAAGGIGHAARPATGAAAPRIEVVNEGPAVLLAQVTEDMDDLRDQVRRHLEQYGIPVLPANLYPQGGAEFAGAFGDDLAKAALFVQLLGPVAGRRPPDLPQGYAQFQFETAAAGKIPSMLWRRPDIDPASITGPHATLIGHPSVQAMSLQSFKAEIVRKIQTPPPPPPRPPSEHAGGTIFINAVREDSALAEKLQEEFASEGCMAMVPMWEGKPEAISMDRDTNIVDCDALVLVYGVAENAWVRGQLRLYNKLKPQRADPGVVVICNAPPGPKAPIGIQLPEAYEIDYARMLEPEPVADLLSRLRH